MYAVSKEYKEAMKQPVQHFRIRGTIDNTMGTVLEFTEKNLLQFRTANQCTDSGTIKIGGVYVGELSAVWAVGRDPIDTLYYVHHGAHRLWVGNSRL